MDARSQQVLQSLLLRDSRSLLQYVSEAEPWTRRGDHQVVELVQGLAHEERDALGTIARFLIRKHVLPAKSGGYPSDYTTLNFIALDHLLPSLADAAARCVKELEQHLPAVADPDAHGLASRYLAMKQRHLRELQNPSEAAATTTVHH